jgi:hypothetical protein
MQWVENRRPATLALQAFPRSRAERHDLNRRAVTLCGSTGGVLPGARVVALIRRRHAHGSGCGLRCGRLLGDLLLTLAFGCVPGNTAQHDQGAKPIGPPHFLSGVRRVFAAVKKG